jgi:hypothetical protein
MKHIVIAAVATCFALFSIPAAEAAGCLKGAAIGGVAGHFMHHHAILGAAVGCAIGHHMAVKRERGEKTLLHPQKHGNDR